MPAPDVGTNEQTMAWVMDTYSMHVGQATTAVVTGKPIELGGSRGRKEATGRGVMICVDKAIENSGMKKDGCRTIIQGFGNVGSMAADLMQQGRIQNYRTRRHRRRPIQRKRIRHSQGNRLGDESEKAAAGFSRRRARK